MLDQRFSIAPNVFDRLERRKLHHEIKLWMISADGRSAFNSILSLLPVPRPSSGWTPVKPTAFFASPALGRETHLWLCYFIWAFFPPSIFAEFGFPTVLFSTLRSSPIARIRRPTNRFIIKQWITDCGVW